MSDLLQLVVSEGAADLHLRVGVPPVIRLHGVLHRVEGPHIRPEDTEELMRSITSEDHIQQCRERGGADFGFAFGELARFRVSVFKEKGNFGLVLRQIPTKMLTLERIGLPKETIMRLLYKPRGLVLVTGPTGSGKTTTLASMINIINEDRDDAHIITIEDPIEYQLEGTVQIQVREQIGLTFASGLRSVLRHDPDVQIQVLGAVPMKARDQSGVGLDVDSSAPFGVELLRIAQVARMVCTQIDVAWSRHSEKVEEKTDQ